MARVLADIENEVRALGRNDQVRLLRALLDALEALPEGMSPRRIRAEIEVDLAAANDYVARHGSFADLAREHYASTDDMVEKMQRLCSLGADERQRIGGAGRDYVLANYREERIRERLVGYVERVIADADRAPA